MLPHNANRTHGRVLQKVCHKCRFWAAPGESVVDIGIQADYSEYAKRNVHFV